MNDRPITEAFGLIMEIAELLGAAPVNRHAGCWEHRFGDAWLLAVNAHEAPSRCSTGVEVLPFHAYIECNGWPAALLTPYGGTTIGGSEDELIAALTAARDTIARTKGVSNE